MARARARTGLTRVSPDRWEPFANRCRDMPPLDRRDILASNIPSEIQTRITAYEIPVIIRRILQRTPCVMLAAAAIASSTLSLAKHRALKTKKKRETELEKTKRQSHIETISGARQIFRSGYPPDVLLSAFPPFPRYPRANWQSASPPRAGRRIDVDVGVGVASSRVAAK